MKMRDGSVEEIQQTLHQAIQAGQIPAPDAYDNQNRPLLELATLAPLFGLSLEQAEIEMNDFWEHIAEVACYGPVHSIQ